MTWKRHTALALDLDQDGEVLRSLTVPRLERGQQLETIRLGVHGNVDGSPIGGRRLECVFTRVITTGRELVTSGVGELELLAVGTDEGVGQGVEAQRTGESHGGDDIRGGDKGMGCGVCVVTSSEVTVVGSDD
jgi:hypothetical protein